MSHPHDPPQHSNLADRPPTPFSDHMRKIGEDLLEEIRLADLEIARLEAELAALQKAKETVEPSPLPVLDDVDREMHEAIEQRPSIPRFRVDAHGRYSRREESFNNLRPAAIDFNTMHSRAPTVKAPPADTKTPHPNPLPSGARGLEREHSANNRRVSERVREPLLQRLPDAVRPPAPDPISNPTPHQLPRHTPIRVPRPSLLGRASQRQALPSSDPAPKLFGREGLRRRAHRPFPLTRLPIAAETAKLNRIDFL